MKSESKIIYFIKSSSGHKWYKGGIPILLCNVFIFLFYFVINNKNHEKFNLNNLISKYRDQLKRIDSFFNEILKEKGVEKCGNHSFSVEIK